MPRERYFRCGVERKIEFRVQQFNPSRLTSSAPARGLCVSARRVTRIQAELDGADHDTTTADFMAKHGALWAARRGAIMGEIDARRTEAIWALGRMV
jgi:hypothetical protein